MGKSFTDEQRSAIGDRGHTLLVSAAAGSGKTTVLINRIVGIVTSESDGVNLDRLLVVTYTKAAAAEIRDRLTVALGQALSENPSSKRLLRQLAMVPSARIDTMDAFFLDVIRKNFDKVGLPANFSVCDEGTASIMLSDACNALIERYYESESENGAFYKLVENVGSSNDDSSFEVLLKLLYTEIYSFAEPEEYLDGCIAEYESLANGTLDFTDSRFYKAVRDDFELLLAHHLKAVGDAFETVKADDGFKNYVAAFEQVYDTLDKISRSKSYSELYFAANRKKTAFGVVKKVDEQTKQRVKEARDEAQSFIDGTLKKAFCLSPEDLKKCCEEYALYARLLKKLLMELDGDYLKLKKSKGLITFADMKRFCYGLFFEKRDGKRVFSEIARDVAKDYKEIFIDEYQDTDEIQDKIFSALSELSGANRFMVGDMKQCIYAFRGSRPKLFADYYNSFPTLSKDCVGSARIVLAHNFRSDESVISAVNQIFGALMRKRLSDVDYCDGQALEKKKDGEKGHAVELLISASEEKLTSEQKGQLQAKNCAREIARLIATGEYKAEDIAILIRFNRQLPIYKKALSDVGIETHTTDKTDAFKGAEIRLVRAVLCAVDNPARDIPLASALCSPVFGFDLSDLARLSLFQSGSLYESLLASRDEKSVHAVEYLAELKKFSLCNGIDKLIFKIIKDSGIDRAVKREKNGKLRYENLLRFIKLSRTYNSENYRGLSDFLGYCDNLEKTQATKMADSSGSGVTVCSIHSSKGLEYPVCFVAGCEAELFKSGAGRSIIYDDSVPYAFPLTRQNGFVRLKPPPFALVNHLARHKPISEELRLLYVALTRAKEKLYISCAAKEDAFVTELRKIDLQSDPASDYYVFNANSQLELVLRSLAARAPGALERLIYDDKKVAPWLKVRFILENGEDGGHVEVEEKKIKLPELYPDYVYGHGKEASIPAKLSVSDINDDGEREYPKAKGELPSFMGSGTASSAQIGTAMHSFMQFCDFELAERYASTEITRLREQGFISKAQAELMDAAALSKFFKTELYARMKKARRIFRELRYNLSQSASRYFDAVDTGKESLLVQGVIDCFFEDENGEIVLIDFKTDRVKKSDGEEILRQRHTPQLELYAEAVELMLGKKVARAYVYSFALEKEIVCI